MREQTACPMDSLLRTLMGPWTTYILWILRSEGPTRFGELKRWRDEDAVKTARKTEAA